MPSLTNSGLFVLQDPAQISPSRRPRPTLLTYFLQPPNCISRIALTGAQKVNAKEALSLSRNRGRDPRDMNSVS